MCRTYILGLVYRSKNFKLLFKNVSTEAFFRTFINTIVIFILLVINIANERNV